MEHLNTQIRACEKCDLCENGLAVPGEGSVDAEVMFIGEAPGRVESETGRPFVGPAGHFLTELIESIGRRREDVFITSVVKHRPPMNRKPTQKEINACLPYLKEQIEIIKPKVIVLLGSTALNAVLGKEVGKITALHGRTVERGGIIYFITFHPAAGLRSVDVVRKQLKEDFKKLGSLLGKESRRR